MEEGLVSEETFQELEATGTEKAMIDELKQINEKTYSANKVINGLYHGSKRTGLFTK